MEDDFDDKTAELLKWVANSALRIVFGFHLFNYILFAFIGFQKWADIALDLERTFGIVACAVSQV